MKKKLLVGMSTLVLVALVGCGQKAIEKPVTETSKTSVEAVSETSSTSEIKADATQISIASVDEIVVIYQKQFPNTDISSIQLEKERTGFVYQVEGLDDDNEYELKINGETKEIIRDKTEKLDRDEKGGIKRESERLDLSEMITLDKATEIAEKEAGSGQAVEWDLDKELGTTYWEVKVRDGKKETQVKLDAKTGDVLEVELDD